MHLPSLKTVLFALLLCGLVVPTGAVVTDGAGDDVFEQNGIVLKPADGPNGEYASIGDDGNITIDITNPGVNDDGITVIRQIFVIENTGEHRTRVWLTHDAPEAVTLYENVSSGVLDGTAVDRRSLGAESNRTLAPEDRLVVSLAINTQANETDMGTALLSEITLHAQKTGTPTETVTETETETESDTERPVTETETATRTATPEPLGPDEDVSVQFDDSTSDDGSVSVTSVPIESVKNVRRGVDPDPTAIITNQNVTKQPADVQSRLNDSGINAITTVGQSTELEGTQSYITSSDGVDRDLRVVKAVNITPPAGSEDSPATIRLRIDREQFGPTDPSNARVGRLTERGWQLLRTTVVSSNEETVVLEARTPGFSTFAAFASPQVTYEWTLPNGSKVYGEEARPEFEEPGVYNVTLTVQDSLGNSDATNFTILANDKPTVDIEVPENVSAGTETTLRANVSNEVGNVTVAWRLPNGTEVTGRTLNYSFQNGSTTLEVRAVDEYNATGTDEETITFGADDQQRGAIPALVSNGFDLLVWVVLVSVSLGALYALHRLTTLQLPSPYVGLAGWWRRHTPDIVTVESPTWDVRRSRFEIERLRIDDAGDDLSFVELTLATRDGQTIARKTLELTETGRYESTGVRIPGIQATDIHPQGEYVLHVRALDDASKEVTATTAVAITMPTLARSARQSVVGTPNFGADQTD